MKNSPIAHFRKTISGNEPQLLWDHLLETSSLAGRDAGKIGLKEAGELLGIFHDLGKASHKFQTYILSATGLIDPDSDDFVNAALLKGKVDHSSAGAQIVFRNLAARGPEGQVAAQIYSLCIASHHSGLIDCFTPDGNNNFNDRIEKPEEQTFAEEAFSSLENTERRFLDELLSNEKLVRPLVLKLKSLREAKDSQDTLTFKIGLLLRFLFSCLIDADRLSTANFESPGDALLRHAGEYQSWETLIQRFNKKYSEFEDDVNKTEINQLRSQVSDACLDYSTRPRGIFKLSVPTGGGKTFSSLRFALNHAAYHKMDRILYIIPYTSIIDQNAEEVRKIIEDRDARGNFLDTVVLEHHSNLTPDEESKRQYLYSQNWDAPVIFTTMVQFLETLFGAGTRGVRRMHQLANSVVIFDEVQTIPIRCVHMFNVAIRFLVNNCGSTVVLCTATQPLLDNVEPISRGLFVSPEMEIASNQTELFNQLVRYQVFDRRKDGGLNDQDVADLAEDALHQKGSVLIIVNTRKSARSLFQTISMRRLPHVYHLSTNMCPAHRLEILREIKEKLSTSQPVVCISTQLIEAGVDIDFGAVIRYLAGLDSIVQAAGRCNRHGLRRNPDGTPNLGHVYIVNPAEENIDNLEDIKKGIQVSERLLDEYLENPDQFDNERLGLKMLNRYYTYYFYARKDDMRYKVGVESSVGRNDDLFNLLACNQASVTEHEHQTGSQPNIFLRQSFKSAANSFHAIDSVNRGIVTPYLAQGEQIIADLCSTQELEKQYKLLKLAQRYSVNLFPHEFKRLVEVNAIREVQDGSGIYYLDDQYYDQQFGWVSDAVNDMKFLIC